MAIDFPSSPSTNELYYSNGKAWKWDGSAWTSIDPDTNPNLVVGIYDGAIVGGSASSDAAKILPSGISYMTPRGAQMFRVAGSYTFTVPSGVYFIKATVVGGGGGGGGGDTDDAVVDGANGGGGGGAAVKYIQVLPGKTLSIVVGAGGTAGARGQTVPTAGGTGGTSSLTYLTMTVSATGGAGGDPARSGITAGGLGGTAAGGDFVIDGQNGGVGLSYAAFSDTATSLDVANGGDGGGTIFGPGGRASADIGSTMRPAATPNVPGAGGGGGGNNSSLAAAEDGAAGAAGCVLLEW